MRPRLSLLCLLCLLVARVAFAQAVDAPVAVMPFQNLGGAAKFDWLRVGIAETMVSDLQRSGRVKVVERAQIDRAMAEVALHGGGTDEGAAARVGKMVGARTVVVGAFQEAGREVRISARFVAVESGLVRGAAKVTGPLENIFSLQDAVVEKLLGLPSGGAPSVTHRAARRGSPKMLQAYELYAKAAQSGSDADKVTYLKQSLAIDPGFIYASDDLAALERRMAGYSQTATRKVAVEDQALFTRLDDARAPVAERARAAAALIDSLTASRRFHTLADVAARAYAQKLAPDAREAASYALFVAHDRLHQFDLALQVGERHLKEFPTGAHFRTVENRMHEIVDLRRAREKRRKEYATDLAEKLKDASPGVEADFAPCIAARWNNQVNELMLDGCSSYLARHGRDGNQDARDHAVAARFFVILALAERGDFEKARPLAEQLIADSDEWDTDLRDMMSTWPTD